MPDTYIKYEVNSLGIMEKITLTETSRVEQSDETTTRTILGNYNIASETIDDIIADLKTANVL